MSRRLSASALLVSSVLLAACTGNIAGGLDDSLVLEPSPATPVDDPLAPGTDAGGASPPLPPGTIDPGRVAIHRLNNTEYDNTLRDLLGTASKPAAELSFLAEEGFDSFDNTAISLGMTSSQYRKYFDAAALMMDESLANTAQRQRFMGCAPAAADDPCAQQIIETFGKRIYRRPLAPDEVARALRVFTADFARTQDGAQAIGQALRAMLSAAHFLYRIEHDEDPASTVPHQLAAYELAARLSYFIWSSMPDDALFEAAERGDLQNAAALEQEVERMLADPKAIAFTESFAGQAFQLRKLYTHSVTAQVFPTFTSTLVDAMIAEGFLWFDDFLKRDAPVTAWFTEDFNYVNDELARHYGMPEPGTGDQLVRVEVTDDQRSGFLGLAGFLTLTSVPSRTSPTYRGAWLLSHLLCSPPAPPPAGVPPLDESAPTDPGTPSGSENVRERLERHRTDPACASCHTVIDPLGMGLEHFDGIGRYREEYGNGDAIDASGVLKDGPAFSGAAELAPLIAADPRFTKCIATKMFTYALGREVEAYDRDSMLQLNERWLARGLTLVGLMKEIVLSDAFRYRRGEVE